MIDNGNLRIAYFSMEIALDPSIATYSGGLGVSAGDMLRPAVDLGVLTAAVTRIHCKGTSANTSMNKGTRQMRLTFGGASAERIRRTRSHGRDLAQVRIKIQGLAALDTLQVAPRCI